MLLGKKYSYNIKCFYNNTQSYNLLQKIFLFYEIKNEMLNTSHLFWRNAKSKYIPTVTVKTTFIITIGAIYNFKHSLEVQKIHEVHNGLNITLTFLTRSSYSHTYTCLHTYNVTFSTFLYNTISFSHKLSLFISFTLPLIISCTDLH